MSVKAKVFPAGRMVLLMVVLALLVPVLGPPGRAWAIGSVDAFVAKYNGQFVFADSVFGAQCTDLFNQFHIEVVGGHYVRMGGNGGAKNLWTTSNSEMLTMYDRVDRGAPAQKGDVAVFDNGTWGHVAIVLSDGSRLQVFQQNTCGTNDAGVNICPAEISPISKTSLLGYFRPKGQNAAPFGSLDVTGSEPGLVRVAGWAIDQDVPSNALNIHVYVGGPAGAGEGHDVGLAGGSRSDVGQVYPWAGASHGYDVLVATEKRGTQSVFVYAINQPAGDNVLLGQGTVSIADPNPLGNLDLAASSTPGTVRVTGWSFDPNRPKDPVRIHVYVGGPAGSGEFHDIGLARSLRKDVQAAYPITSDVQGFDAVVRTQLRGTQPVYVYALNLDGTPGVNVLLGSGSAAIAAPVMVVAPAPSRADSCGTADTYRIPSLAGVEYLVGGKLVSAGSHSTGGAATVVVTARAKAGFGLTGTTKWTLSFSRLACTLTKAPVPTVSGAARVGSTLTALAGVWQPAPVSLGFQWLRNGAPIAGATKVSYVLSANDLGKAMSVRVTGSRAGYASLARTSAATAKVAAGVLSASVPKISGTKKVGRKLTVKPGTWKPVGVVLRVQWYRSGKAIAGATAVTYKLVKADKGKRISVKVTGTKSGYTTVTKTSKKTSKVKK